MKRNLIYFCSGIVAAIFIFCLPTITLGRGEFTSPLFFETMVGLFPWLMSSWLLLSLPYVLLALVLGAIFSAWWRVGFWKRFQDILWFGAGLYLSLSFFFWLLATSINALTF